MDRRKKLFFIFGGIALAFFIAGIILVCLKSTEMPYFAISIVILVISAMLLSVAGVFRPIKEKKK